jgi:hypothetical protein
MLEAWQDDPLPAVIRATIPGGSALYLDWWFSQPKVAFIFARG